MGIKEIKKGKAGVEDLLLGFDSETQNRGSGPKTINPINADTIPYSPTSGSIKDVITSLNSVTPANGLTPEYEIIYDDITGDLLFNLIGYLSIDVPTEEW